MKSKRLLLTLLMALLVPWVANAQTSLFSEDFESGSMPTGWTTDGSGTWSVATGDYSSSTGAGNGTYNAKITHGTTGDATKLITPEIDLSSVSSAELSFMHVQRSWSGDIDGLKVYYRTSTNSTWKMLVEYSSAYASWTTEEGIALPDLTSTYQIAFEYIDNWGYGIGIDYVNIVQGASCIKPTGLDVTLTPGDGTKATFSWTENGTATQWQLCLNGDETNLIEMTENPFTYTGLTAETPYTAKVRAYCGATDQSAWSNEVTFTPTNAYSITVNDGTSTNQYVPFYGYYGDSDANSQFIIPATDLGAMQWGTINAITFYGSSASATWTGAVFDIYFSEVNNTVFESAALVDWSELDSKVYTGSVSVVDNKMELTLTAPYQYMGGNLLIGFDETSNSSNYPSMPWYGVTQTTNTAVYKYSSNAAVLAQFLPKVTFSYTPGEEPDCYMPTGLAVSYTGGTEATISWTSEATAWNIDVNGTVTAITENPYTLTGLELATNYEVKVQADCGDSQSDWTNATSFTTDMCMPENQCEISYSFTDQYNDSWNGAYMNIVDAATGSVLYQLTMPNEAGPYTGSFAVCDGRDIQFVWVSGSYPNECGYTFTDINGETILEKATATTAPSAGVVTTYTVSCTIINCKRPTNVAASNVTNHSATLTWTAGNEEQTAWQIACSTKADFDPDAVTELIDVTEATYTFNQTLAAATTYYVYVRGNCGDETSNWSKDVCSFTTGEAAPAPTGLTATNLASQTVDLYWTAGGGDFEGFWEVYYTDDATFAIADYTSGAVDVNTLPTAEAPYTLGGLTPETQYYWWVRAYNGPEDGYSAWTAGTSFTTLASCPIPTNVAATNLTQNTADITWTGSSDVDSYNVRYCEAGTVAPVLEEGFEDETEFANWQAFGAVETNVTGSSRFGRITGAAKTGSYGFSFNSWSSATDYNQYLISPELTSSAVLEFQYKCSSNSSSGEMFRVGYSSTDTELESFTWGSVTTVTGTDWHEFSENIPSGTKYVCINYCVTSSQYCLYIDDLVIGNIVDAGSWTVNTVSTTNTTLNSLTANTKYDVQVQSGCNRDSEWSDVISFTTLAEGKKVFATAGNWGTENNWVPAGMPALTEDVIIRANATIESGIMATANTITFEGTPTPTLTIADGGQLQHNNSSSITATVKKNVTGYSADNANTNNGYVLLAPPFGKYIYQNNSDGTGLRNGTYDLYSWARTNALEWTNYGSSNSSYLYMSRGTGYLYANQEDTEITFAGSIYGSGSSYSQYLYYTAPTAGTTDFSDWNLLGNPFVCNAYLVDAATNGNALAFYKMNADGNGFEATTGTAIAPMEGVFYQATAAGYVYFTREMSATSTQPGTLNINLAQMVTNRGEKGATDNAIIRFGEGNTLGKFSFNENSAKVYIPQNGKDYAVVNAGNVGEMPVNFKANENGSYTLSFSNSEVTFSYLHLIDNMTGADVDLLANPSYSFDARTTDYASRFRLVFSTGSSATGDNFGFINGMGNLCIFGIEGTATVQVVDVTGRMLSSETFSGSYERKLNVAPGVYMIRLINGNDVKVQKMIVR